MRRLVCVLLCFLGGQFAHAESEIVGGALRPESFRDLHGTPIPLHARWLVLVFLSPECPIANAELPVLNALAAEFSPQGFDFVGAYPDPTLEPAALQRHAAESHLAFVAADDRTQQLVRATGATYTPEVFVYAISDGALLYRGRIDDRARGFGTVRPTATRQDLREVLTALVAGATGPFPTQKGFGCAIATEVKR